MVWFLVSAKIMKYNRRKFLKLCVAISALAILPIPKKLFGATERDDTAFVQWHIDNGKLLPCGEYKIKSLLFERGGVLRLDKGSFHCEVLKND